MGVINTGAGNLYVTQASFILGPAFCLTSLVLRGWGVPGSTETQILMFRYDCLLFGLFA